MTHKHRVQCFFKLKSADQKKPCVQSDIFFRGKEVILAEANILLSEMSVPLVFHDYFSHCKFHFQDTLEDERMDDNTVGSFSS